MKSIELIQLTIVLTFIFIFAVTALSDVSDAETDEESESDVERHGTPTSVCEKSGCKCNSPALEATRLDCSCEETVRVECSLCSKHFIISILETG